MQVMEGDGQQCVCHECWLELKPDTPYPEMDVSLTIAPFVVSTTDNTVLISMHVCQRILSCHAGILPESIAELLHWPCRAIRPALSRA